VALKAGGESTDDADVLDRWVPWITHWSDGSALLTPSAIKDGDRVCAT
jgi:hypothetical protein